MNILSHQGHGNSELKKPLGREGKCLQEIETSPAAYDTTLRFTMTWTTENLYQHVKVVLCAFSNVVLIEASK